jgi:hypothetical protein
MKIRIYSKISFLILSVVFTGTACSSQQAAEHDKTNHDKHYAEVNERGDHAMGFSHTKTAHRFRLLTNGGAIEVRANNADDKESLEQIRKHLGHISKEFSAGNFEAPFLTHGKVPPGVPVMKRLAKEINYEYEEVESGARVRLSTKNAEALAAIHDFIKFQIEDHKTGDSLEIEKP